MVDYLRTIPRDEKRRIALRIHENLTKRLSAGPAEPGLDDYVPELAAVAQELETHVAGKTAASGSFAAKIAAAETADVEVDTWLRHIEAFLYVEGTRRLGSNVPAAAALYHAACPDGLGHVDDRIVDENRHCREMIKVLQAPENQSTLASIGLPPAWITTFEAAVNASDGAVQEVIQARERKSSHVELGLGAEEEWADVVMRLRRYIGSRARRGDIQRINEGKSFLAPLQEAVQKMRSDASARATRRAKQTPPPDPKDVHP